MKIPLALRSQSVGWTNSAGSSPYPTGTMLAVDFQYGSPLDEIDLAAVGKFVADQAPAFRAVWICRSSREASEARLAPFPSRALTIVGQTSPARADPLRTQHSSCANIVVRPRAIRGPVAGTPSSIQLDWPQWMRALARQGRRAREFLGLTQEQLAAMAGVSQGAVSRFEAGRGLATPMLIVVKIGLALMRELRRVDPSLLNDELTGLLDLEHYLSPPIGEVGFQALPLTRDADFEELVRAYRSLPDRQRRTFLTAVRATAAALGTANGASSADSRSVTAKR